MRHLRLIRRREFWVPTAWGWLALLACAIAMSITIALNLYSFLAQNDPAGARLLVVEGWLEPPELDQAIVAFQTFRYERVVTTGGPTMRWPEDPARSTFADLSADYLKHSGMQSSIVASVPAPYVAEDHTFASAIAVREWVRRQTATIDAIDVFSAGPHARRSRLIYQSAFGPGVRIGILAARSPDYDARRWWATSAGMRDVLVQAGGLIWIGCCFWPASAPASNR